MRAKQLFITCGFLIITFGGHMNSINTTNCGGNKSVITVSYTQQEAFTPLKMENTKRSAAEVITKEDLFPSIFSTSWHPNSKLDTPQSNQKISSLDNPQPDQKKASLDTPQPDQKKSSLDTMPLNHALDTVLPSPAPTLVPKPIIVKVEDTNLTSILDDNQPKTMPPMTPIKIKLTGPIPPLKPNQAKQPTPTDALLTKLPISTDLLGNNGGHHKMAERLKTFSYWPAILNYMVIPLAECGFVYTGIGDIVRCYKCAIIVRHWTIKADVLQNHKRLSPNCSVVHEIQNRFNLAFWDEKTTKEPPRNKSKNFTCTSCKNSMDVLYAFVPCGHTMCLSCCTNISCVICLQPKTNLIRVIL